MTKYTLKDSEYTFDASEKTITLDAPWDNLSVGQILRIKNLTKNEVIYDQDSALMNSSHEYSSYSLTLSGAVITHALTSSDFADTDKLQIIIDTELDFTDADRILIEIEPIQPSDIGVSDWVNFQGIKDPTLYVSSLVAFRWYVQFTDDNSTDAAGFDLCNSTGTALEFTTVGKGNPIVAAGKCIPITAKGTQMRLIAKNEGVTAEAPYGAIV